MIRIPIIDFPGDDPEKVQKNKLYERMMSSETKLAVIGLKMIFLIEFTNGICLLNESNTLFNRKRLIEVEINQEEVIRIILIMTISIMKATNRLTNPAY